MVICFCTANSPFCVKRHFPLLIKGVNRVTRTYKQQESNSNKSMEMQQKSVSHESGLSCFLCGDCDCHAVDTICCQLFRCDACSTGSLDAFKQRRGT